MLFITYWLMALFLSWWQKATPVWNRQKQPNFMPRNLRREAAVSVTKPRHHHWATLPFLLDQTCQAVYITLTTVLIRLHCPYRVPLSLLSSTYQLSNKRSDTLIYQTPFVYYRDAQSDLLFNSFSAKYFLLHHVLLRVFERSPVYCRADFIGSVDGMMTLPASFPSTSEFITSRAHTIVYLRWLQRFF